MGKVETKNPFQAKPVVPSDMFFGRKKEIERLFSDIASHANISLVGERKIGKTSFLKFLCHLKKSSHTQEATILRDPDKFEFYYLDMSTIPDISSWDEFFKEVLKGINVVKVENQTNNNNWYDTFKNWLTNSPKYIVLLLDEFDSIVSNPIFDNNFFSAFRGLAYLGEYNLSLVTSSVRPLGELCHSEIQRSPFFNIFYPMRLGSFTAEETFELIQSPFFKAGIHLNPAELNFIIENGGHFPFFVSRICYHLYNRKIQWQKESQNNEKIIDMVLKDFEDDAEQHFTYAWKYLPDEEKRVLLTLSFQEKLQSEEETIIKSLKTKGYLLDQNSDRRVFSSTFAKFIRESCAREYESYAKETWRALQNDQREELLMSIENFDSRELSFKLSDYGISLIENKIPPFVFKRYILDHLEEFKKYFDLKWSKMKKKPITNSIKLILQSRKEKVDADLIDALDKIGFDKRNHLFYPNLIMDFIKKDQNTVKEPSSILGVNLKTINTIILFINIIFGYLVARKSIPGDVRSDLLGILEIAAAIFAAIGLGALTKYSEKAGSFLSKKFATLILFLLFIVLLVLLAI